MKAWMRLSLKACVPMWVVALVVDLSATMTAGQELPALESILKVWREREVATKTVRVEFEGDYVMGNDSLMGGPPVDVTAREERLIVIDGVKMRYERRGDKWIGGARGMEYFSTISVFDGQLSKTLSEPRRAGEGFHTRGWITRSQGHRDKSNIYLSPILQHYRPLSPVFAVIKTEQLRVASAGERVDGLSCIVLEESQPEKAQVRRFWVAPDRGMGIVRFAGLLAGEVVLQADVGFRRDADGWVPSRWKAIRFNKRGQLLDSMSAVVSRIEVNSPVPATTFDVAFPPGTELLDGPAMETGAVGSGAAAGERR